MIRFDIIMPMIESMGERPWEHHRSPELSDTLKDPRTVFDSDIPTADDQFDKVIQDLAPFNGVYRVRSTQVQIDHKIDQSLPSISLFWPDAHIPSALRLTPVAHLGYHGEWGHMNQTENGWELKAIPLSAVWGVPENKDLLIKPTIDRWAVDLVERQTDSFDYPTHTVYAGIGFLLLGQPWMHIGNHEVAGHLPNIHDENVAWTRAHQWTKKVHAKSRQQIRQGTYHGMFDSLASPSWYRKLSEEPTIGEIAMYGLSSYAAYGEARAPQHWDIEGNTTQLMKIIKDAHGRYNQLVYAR